MLKLLHRRVSALQEAPLKYVGVGGGALHASAPTTNGLSVIAISRVVAHVVAPLPTTHTS